MDIKLILILDALIQLTTGFYAYDCTHDKINVTHVSLSNIKSCSVLDKDIKEENLEVQVLQLSDVKLVKVYQCKVNVVRSINICGGMISYVKAVEGGLSQYLEKIGRDQCIDMHRYKSFEVSRDLVIKDLLLNGTTYSTAVTTGVLDREGYCKGGTVNHNGVQYSDAIVQASYTITLNDYYTEALLDDDVIELRSRKSCSYKQGECLDTDHGYSFWNPVEGKDCFVDSYTVLYEGPATRTFLISDASSPVYTIKTDDVLISLTSIRPTAVCGLPAFQSEHPKLLITPKLGSSFAFKKRKLTKGNFDIFTYANTKFVYLERHIQTQMKEMYKEIINDRCIKNREILFTQAAIGINHPDEFARIYMKVEGYTAIVAGEGIHIIQCQPVEVQVRTTNLCYNELPVVYQNKSMFMTPYNRILKSVGTERICTTQLPSAWNINGKYYTLSPHLIESKPPLEMDPREIGNWDYKSPGNLMKGGIIDYSDLEQMNKAIMYNFDKQSVSDGIVYRSTNGGSSDTVNLSPFLDKKEIENIASNVLSKTFWWIHVFGEYSAALIGLYFIFRLIKSFLDAIFHGMILYDLWGFSWRLVTGFWDALSMYIAHIGTMKEKWNKDRYATKSTASNCEKSEQKCSVNDGGSDEPMISATQKKSYPSLNNDINLSGVQILRDGIVVKNTTAENFPSSYYVDNNL